MAAGNGNHLNGWWKGAALAVFAVSALFWGGYTYHRLATAEEAQASTSAELRDHAARIITLEADKRAIKESLEEIKGSLKDLTRKIDQLPR